MTTTILLRLLSPSRRRRKKALHYSLLSLLLLVTAARSIDIKDPFPNDHLTPYPDGKHGSTRTSRDIGSCLHTKWSNRTVETFKLSTKPPSDHKAVYQHLKFADVAHQGPLRRRYAMGSITFLRNPYYTLSVLEPLRPGTCQSGSSYTVKSTVLETAANRKHGCRLAANGGYFTMSTGKCLGNIVTNGHLVQSAGGVQNANFGIKQDGTLVIGYIAEEELYDQLNPFRQLVSGVVWLVRNGTNYVNESMYLECSDHEDTGKMETFVNVISARSAVGHDSEGRVVLARVEGQTHVRGANLHEFADILIKRGVVNAINLDGGGSNTLVEDGLLLNYPSDHCRGDGKYRCPRPVSTVLCVHDVECLEPDCSNHGSCDQGMCSCDQMWDGERCDVLNCTLTNCTDHGICTDGSCQCEAGWHGDLCDQSCPHNRYGPDCKSYCYCYGKGHCHPVFGNCTCSPGYHGRYCWDKCKKGHYGVNCIHKCPYPDCSGHGECSVFNGSCLCHEGWTGISCNDSLELDNSSSVDLHVSLSKQTITSSPSSSSLCPSLITSTVTVVQSVDICTDNSTTTTVPSLPNDQFTAILILTAIGTLVAHLLLCIVHVICCRNGGVGVAFNKAEIKRELMERREWQQIMLENSHWTSSSSSSED